MRTAFVWLLMATAALGQMAQQLPQFGYTRGAEMLILFNQGGVTNTAFGSATARKTVLTTTGLSYANLGGPRGFGAITNASGCLSLDVDSISPGTGPMTIAAWFEIAVNSGFEQTFFANYGSAQNNLIYLEAETDAKLESVFRDGSANAALVHAGPSVADGKWHFACSTWGAGTNILYLDGNVVGSTFNASVGTINTGGGNSPGIGCFSGGGNSLGGQLWMVYVAYSCLTSNQDLDLMLGY